MKNQFDTTAVKRMITNPEELCSARRMTLSDGRGAGLKVIECSNGVFDMTLTESRCLDITQLRYRGMNIGFLSKNGINADPHIFVGAFPGGMIYTCGLDSLSLRDGYEMHGRIHNIPAEEIVITEGERLCVSGVIRDTALFAQNLELHRSITADYGSSRVTLHDTLVNAGYRDAEYALLYHINSGYPFLTPNVKIDGDFTVLDGLTDWARERVGNIHNFEDPVDDSFEQVFFHDEKSGKVRVTSPDTKLAMDIIYSRETLPCLTEWKSPVSGDYALGIEPATSHMGNRFAYRSIRPGEAVEFEVTLAFEELK